MKGVLQDPSINVDLRAFEVGNDIILMSTNVSLGVRLIADSYNKGKISEVEFLFKNYEKQYELGHTCR